LTIFTEVNLPRVLLIVNVDVQVFSTDGHEERFILFNVYQVDQLCHGDVCSACLESWTVKLSITDAVGEDFAKARAYDHDR